MGQDAAPEIVPSCPMTITPIEPRCNVTLECTASSDLTGERHQSLTRCLTEDSSWRIGPRQQVEMFSYLLPEKAATLPTDLFELAFHPPCLSLTKLAQGMSFSIKGSTVTQESFALWDKVDVSLCEASSSVPCMSFRVRLGEVAPQSDVKDVPAAPLDDTDIRLEVDLRGKDTDEAEGCLNSLKARERGSKIVV